MFVIEKERTLLKKGTPLEKARLTLDDQILCNVHFVFDGRERAPSRIEGTVDARVGRRNHRHHVVPVASVDLS